MAVALEEGDHHPQGLEGDTAREKGTGDDLQTTAMAASESRPRQCPLRPLFSLPRAPADVVYPFPASLGTQGPPGPSISLQGTWEDQEPPPSFPQ